MSGFNCYLFWPQYVTVNADQAISLIFFSNYFILHYSTKYCMFRIYDYTNNHINKEFRNNGSDIIIHEHEFVPISLKGEGSIICLTCGSFYSEETGKLFSITTRNIEKLVHQ
jgi:hypothetical protein